MGRTIQAPGTSQAFHRSGLVIVEVGGVKAGILRPDVVGALLGKVAAVVKIPSQSSASRAKHLRDVDSLARLLGAPDRNGANLTKSERRMVVSLSGESDLSELAVASLAVLVRSGSE